MPPLPTRKRSRSTQGRHSSHLRLGLPARAECPRCHSVKLPHRICPTCGYYNDRDVLHKEAGTEKEQG